MTIVFKERHAETVNAEAEDEMFSFENARDFANEFFPTVIETKFLRDAIVNESSEPKQWSPIESLRRETKLDRFNSWQARWREV